MAIPPITDVINQALNGMSECVRWEPPEKFERHRKALVKAFIALEELRDAVNCNHACGYNDVPGTPFSECARCGHLV